MVIEMRLVIVNGVRDWMGRSKKEVFMFWGCGYTGVYRYVKFKILVSYI